MSDANELLLGEFQRNLDERYRLSVPPELTARLQAEGEDLVLAKERRGCLSLWNAAQWQPKLDSGVQLVLGKLQSGRLDARLEEVQRLGRLLSTRHRTVQLSGRGRLLIPEGFREFLAVEPGGPVVVVGAAVCVEIWRPDAWAGNLEEVMPQFRQLLDELAG